MTWAPGCGASGWISPFGGAAKLPWNLEWAAQWSLFGVTIEPCGKDLSTAGGSRDRSDAIAREVFEREPPLNVPYEFLNIGGKKMSTSKGRGAAAHTIAEVIPPEQLRFLFLRPRPNHAIEFDPDGTDAVPRLFDEFDRFAAATAGREVKGELPPGYEATFRYSLLDPDADVAAEAAAFRPAFAHLALLVQIPGVDVAARVEAEKGSPLTERERAILDERVAAARAWLEAYAPERPARGPARRAAGRGRRRSTPTSARFLAALADAAARRPRRRRRRVADADLRVAAERRTCRRAARSPRIYLAFLGRTERPARRLAAGQPRPGVRRRAAREASGADGRGRCGMSVGLQRLRDEPDVIRDGADPQGRGPGARRSGARARRRAAPPARPRARRSRPSATPPRSGSARRSRPAPRPDGPEVADLRAASTAAGERITALDAALAETEAALDDLLLRIPNPPDPDIPVGGEEANVTIRTWGELLPHEQPLVGEVGADAPAGGATWTRKPHWELGEALDILDNARGAKITGSGFPVYKGAGSALQRGLINWFLDVHTRENGLTEVWPPAVVNARVARAAPARSRTRKTRCTSSPATSCTWSRRPRSRSPTSTATRSSRRPSCRSATPPTRRASGARPARPARTPAASCASTSSTRSRWSCSRGPRTRAAALEWMTERAEILLQRLGLAYRVLLMSTREMGFTQARKYDLEVWSPGVERWLEVSSCSNFRDFQARRMAIRYRPEPGAKPELVHTLNGSGLALARVVAAILETYQRPDGSIDGAGGAAARTWGALPSPEQGGRR